MKFDFSRGIVITSLLCVGGMISADELIDGSSSSVSRDKKKRYDYIIVGGGTAGCILARKLSDNHHNSVLLLEAGGNYVEDPVTLDPNWLDHAGALLSDPKYSIVYPVLFPPLTLYSYTEGHELGGGAAHNFLITVRGTPSIYNGWAATTRDPGWLYNSYILPIMKNYVEDYTPNGTVADPAERGTKGIIKVTQNPPLNPVAGSFLSSLSTVTLTPFVADYNNPSTGDIGISAVQQFVSPGAHSHRSFSGLFLSDVIDANGNGTDGRRLKVITNAQGLDIRINNEMRATSVHYTVQNNEKNEVEYELIKASLTKDTGTLILSAGSINSPKILLQSGVGPAADLEAIGIPVVLDSPHVGQNLQCQYGSSAILTGTVPFEAQAFLDGYPYMANDGVRRLQISNSTIGANIMQALPAITNPKSRGSVTLSTNNPFIQPKVDIALFTDGPVSMPGTDAYLQVSFYKIMKAAATMAGQAVIYPAPAQFANDALLLAAALARPPVLHYVVGTTRMGTDISNSVVNGNLKVHGLENVYVVDAGVQPETVNGGTCYGVYVTAFKFLKGIGAL